MDIKEYLKLYRTNPLSEASGVSEATLRKIQKGGDYLLSTASKLVKGSNGVLTFSALARAIKTNKITPKRSKGLLKEALEPSPKQAIAHPDHISLKPPKKKPKHSKVKNLS